MGQLLHFSEAFLATLSPEDRCKCEAWLGETEALIIAEMQEQVRKAFAMFEKMEANPKSFPSLDDEDNHGTL